MRRAGEETILRKASLAALESSAKIQDISLLLLLFVIIGIGLHLEIKELSPHGRAAAYKEYSQTMPEPRMAEAVRMEDKVYYITTGNMSSVSSWLTFPSGPPQYVFDEQGNLVTWVLDVGEASLYNEKWRGKHARVEPSSIQELAELFLNVVDGQAAIPSLEADILPQ